MIANCVNLLCYILFFAISCHLRLHFFSHKNVGYSTSSTEELWVGILTHTHTHTHRGKNFSQKLECKSHYFYNDDQDLFIYFI